MDKSSVGGILLAVCGILAGLLIEGGNLSQVFQPTAAMIVFGGTLGAVLLQFPLPTIMAAARSIARVFFEGKRDRGSIVDEIVNYAQMARKDGIVSLDRELGKVQDPFLKKSLMLAIDGTEPQELRKMMELELQNRLEREEEIPAVLEAAGGYSPTIGILGAVLGLIQVMQHLDRMDEVGRGIATAFVATIYGVGAANILFLPAAGKLRTRGREEQIGREMMLEGVIAILEGLNPRMVETKLRGFLADSAMKAEQKPS